jgi:glycosyltransferase involved in cell wall biosynthesis
VTFLGEVPQEDLPDHLVSADIFIRASRSEGMGNSFIEAMAAGLPTVGTDAGGIPDFLTEGKTGFVCEPNNPQSVADAVRRVLENPTATQQIVTRAQELVRNQYDWGVVTKAMQKLFTSCLSVVR